MSKVSFIGPDGLPVPVSFKPVGTAPRRFAVQVGYTPLEIHVDIDADGRGVVALGPRRYRVYVAQHDGEVELWIDGQVVRLELFDDTARRADAAATVSRSDTICAPMPGTILDIRITDGQSFAAHDPVIIMESMKMEMTLAVPHAGRVKSILCEVGQLVERGAVLAELHDSESRD